MRRLSYVARYRLLAALQLCGASAVIAFSTFEILTGGGIWWLLPLGIGIVYIW